MINHDLPWLIGRYIDPIDLSWSVEWFIMIDHDRSIGSIYHPINHGRSSDRSIWSIDHDRSIWSIDHDRSIWSIDHLIHYDRSIGSIDYPIDHDKSIESIDHPINHGRSSNWSIG
jgi:hypothetical protein